MYSNGNEEEETAYDWADNRHVGQVALGWVGERLRLGTVLSYERFSHVVEGKDRKDDAMGIHLIASRLSDKEKWISITFSKICKPRARAERYFCSKSFVFNFLPIDFDKGKNNVAKLT